MTDARFSGGSVGLVIGHVGPEAGLGGPIAFVEDGDEIVADLNKNELNCTALADPAILRQRKAAWDKVVAANGGIHPNCGDRRHPPVAPRAAHRRSRHPRRRPASEPRGLGAPSARGNAAQASCRRTSIGRRRKRRFRSCPSGSRRLNTYDPKPDRITLDSRSSIRSRHTRESGYPVRRGLSVNRWLLWNTGSSAFADDDTVGVRRVRRDA